VITDCNVENCRIQLILGAYDLCTQGTHRIYGDEGKRKAGPCDEPCLSGEKKLRTKKS
jgi:hypothetical protein